MSPVTNTDGWMLSAGPRPGTHMMAGADTVFRGKMGAGAGARGIVLSNRITVNMGAEATEQDCRLFYKK